MVLNAKPHSVLVASDLSQERAINAVISHEMMHSGQIAAIRRKLGKPIVI